MTTIPCIFFPGVAVGRGLNPETGEKMDTTKFFTTEKESIETTIPLEFKNINRDSDIKLKFFSILWEEKAVSIDLSVLERFYKKPGVSSLSTSTIESKKLNKLIEISVAPEFDETAQKTTNIQRMLDEIEDLQKSLKKVEDQLESPKKTNTSTLGSETKLSKLLQKARRLLSLGPIVSGRVFFTKKILLFFGDIFIYLNNKKDIQDYILKQFKAILETNPTDSVIIFGHSFGAVIFWDMLTSDKFSPILKNHENLKNIHFISCGSQVQVFDALNLYDYVKTETFKAKDAEKEAKKIFDTHITSWLNCYDDMDVLSFTVSDTLGFLFKSPKITDKRIKTRGGLVTAHGSYFNSSSFCECVARHLLPFLES